MTARLSVACAPAPSVAVPCTITTIAARAAQRLARLRRELQRDGLRARAARPSRGRARSGPGLLGALAARQPQALGVACLRRRARGRRWPCGRRGSARRRRGWIDAPQRLDAGAAEARGERRAGARRRRRRRRRRTRRRAPAPPPPEPPPVPAPPPGRRVGAGGGSTLSGPLDDRGRAVVVGDAHAHGDAHAVGEAAHDRRGRRRSSVS